MNKKEKQFFIFAGLMIVLVIIYYFTYGRDLSANIKTVKEEIKKTEKEKVVLDKKRREITNKLNRWIKTEKDLDILKKEFCYLIKESNLLRFSIEKILNDAGFNPANENMSVTKIGKGFWTLNFKFNTIPRDNIYLLIENIRENKSLVFIASLTIVNFPRASSSVVIKGVLTDEK